MALDYLEKLGKAKEDVKQVASTPVGGVAMAFAEKVIGRMKKKAPTSQPGAGNLKQSLGFGFQTKKDTILIEFRAAKYWDFVNSGVDGVIKSAGAVKNEFGKTYSFKTINPSKKMVNSFLGGGGKQNWLAAKSITSMKFGGKTKRLSTKTDYRKAAYVIARSVKKKGIKPSNFVNDSLDEKVIREFEEKLLDSLEKII